MWGNKFSSVTQSCLTLFDPMDCTTPGLPVHHQLPEFTQTHILWDGDAIQPSHPLSSPSPPAFSLSQHQGFFKWVSSSHLVARVLEFQLYHFAVQKTLKSLLQHHSSKSSILWCSAFFIVQLSHPHMTTGKTIALTRWTYILYESEKVGLKLNIRKTKIMTSGPTTSWQIDWETVETVRDFIFLGSKITAGGGCSHEIKRCLLLRRSYDQPR